MFSIHYDSLSQIQDQIHPCKEYGNSSNLQLPASLAVVRRKDIQHGGDIPNELKVIGQLKKVLCSLRRERDVQVFYGALLNGKVLAKHISLLKNCDYFEITQIINVMS